MPSSSSSSSSQRRNFKASSLIFLLTFCSFVRGDQHPITTSFHIIDLLAFHHRVVSLSPISIHGKTHITNNRLFPPLPLTSTSNDIRYGTVRKKDSNTVVVLYGTDTDSTTDDNNNDDDEITTKSSKSLLLFVSLLSFTTISLLAKTNLLPFSPPYTNPLLFRDLGASLFTALLATIFVKLCTTLYSRGTLDAKDARKIIHTLSAPLFLCVWPLYSDVFGARYFAAVIPFLNGVRLFMAGSGMGGDESELAKAVSRSGEAEEALGGPFIYVLILWGVTVLAWRDNLIGIVALSTMAAGDGMADLIGRRFGKTNKWIFNPDKSIAGTLAFVFSSTMTSVGLALWFDYTNTLSLGMDLNDLILRIGSICLISSIVELLPFLGDDNWSVPLSAAALSAWLLQ